MRLVVGPIGNGAAAAARRGAQDYAAVAAEIIDFKTDALDPSMSLLWLNHRVEHHRPQLEIYAQVVSKLFRIPTDRIATYLVMLSSDDLVRVDAARCS